jgi:hypothetical protein
MLRQATFGQDICTIISLLTLCKQTILSWTALCTKWTRISMCLARSLPPTDPSLHAQLSGKILRESKICQESWYVDYFMHQWRCGKLSFNWRHWQGNHILTFRIPNYRCPIQHEHLSRGRLSRIPYPHSELRDPSAGREYFRPKSSVPLIYLRTRLAACISTDPGSETKRDDSDLQRWHQGVSNKPSIEDFQR